MGKARFGTLLAAALAGACGDPYDGGTGAPPADPPADSPALPAPERVADPGSPEAARAVVAEYYARIAARDHARAHGLWAGDGEASGRSVEEFRAGFAETASAEAEVGTPGRIDPAAGSRFVRVPVAVRARTTDGTDQCFRGAYTLRRSEVEGATAEQQRWRITSGRLESLLVQECTPPGGDDPQGVAAVVEAFGVRLSAVSLLAPPDILLRDLEERYTPYVTAALLEAWLQDPPEAPGRTVSSPWPDRIEVREVERIQDDHYRVAGDVVYVTSVEAAAGGAADRRPVVIDVVRDGGWRIAAYGED